MLYLASQSPQRAMLLRDAGVPFTQVPSTGDEERVIEAHPQLLALGRAKVKAHGAQLPSGADGVVLGADTVTALGNELFGKPTDDEDAVRILRRLSGTTHAVMTGHHAIRITGGQLGTEASAIAIAKVTMRRLSEDEIRAYVATGEHRGKAGAYAIQETADRFVVDLVGSYGCVVGLSVSTVAKLWRELTDSVLPQAIYRDSNIQRAIRPPG